MTHSVDRSLFTAGVIRTYTAVWSWNGIVGGANLVIRNVPGVDTNGQIASQYVPAGQNRVLDPGTADGWEFFGWVRGDNVPATGTNWATWSAVPANAARVYAANYDFGPFVSEQAEHFTAIWGNYDGGDNGNGGDPIVGANLVIRNVPNVDANNQIATQTVPAGQNRVLDPGTADGWVFFGWVRGDDVPATGTNWATWSAVPANAARVYAANYNFGPFVSEQAERFTAIWGNYDGPGNGDNGNGGNPIVGANLVIRNVPNVAVSGQIATQTVPTGESRVLTSGTAVGLGFFGWVRGDDVPAVGIYWADWAAIPANAARIYAANYDFGPFAANESERFTAVWGYGGFVGIANLIIDNVPGQPSLPAGQTRSQVVPVGQARTLAHGTAPAGPDGPLFFGTWIRGDVIPPVGEILEEWLAANPTVPSFGAGHTTQVFAEGTILRYTAIWVCEDGIIGGGGNLIINNIPAQLIRPAGQTRTQVVPIGQTRALAHGTAPAGPDGPLFFGTWIRGNVVPPTGVMLSTWLADNPTVQNFAAGHTTNVFAAGSSYTYTAIWVCEHGVIGGGGYRNIRVFYYIDDGEGELERDIENNPTGRLYSARVGDTFSLETVLDRNELDGDNEYEFEGWLVFVDGEYTQDYIDDLDVDVLHGTFTVPGPDAVALAAAAGGIMALNTVGDEISLVAVWVLVDAEEETPPKRLPQTGVEGNILLWVALLAASLLIGGTTLGGLKKNKTNDEI